MAKAKVQITERMYEIIKRPIVTEKTSQMAAENKVTFEVQSSATKPEIQEAVEALFGVKVESVNTLNQAGKVKRFRGIQGRRNDVKKAIVTMAEGQSIDVTAGV